MGESFGKNIEARHGERGSATIKFLIVLVVIGALIYMGIQYVPVAYRYSSYKDQMQKTVDTAVATGQGTEWVRNQVQGSAGDYDVPHDAQFTPAVQDGRMTVNVKFIRPINLLPGFTYNYTFDYTAKSTPMLGPK